MSDAQPGQPREEQTEYVRDVGDTGAGDANAKAQAAPEYQAPQFIGAQLFHPDAPQGALDHNIAKGYMVEHSANAEDINLHRPIFNLNIDVQQEQNFTPEQWQQIIGTALTNTGLTNHEWVATRQENGTGQDRLTLSVDHVGSELHAPTEQQRKINEKALQQEIEKLIKEQSPKAKIQSQLDEEDDFNMAFEREQFRRYLKKRYNSDLADDDIFNRVTGCGRDDKNRDWMNFNAATVYLGDGRLDLITGKDGADNEAAVDAAAKLAVERYMRAHAPDATDEERKWQTLQLDGSPQLRQALWRSLVANGANMEHVVGYNATAADLEYAQSFRNQQAANDNGTANQQAGLVPAGPANGVTLNYNDMLNMLKGDLAAARQDGVEHAPNGKSPSLLEFTSNGLSDGAKNIAGMALAVQNQLARNGIDNSVSLDEIDANTNKYTDARRNFDNQGGFHEQAQRLADQMASLPPADQARLRLDMLALVGPQAQLNLQDPEDRRELDTRLIDAYLRQQIAPSLDIGNSNPAQLANQLQQKFTHYQQAGNPGQFGGTDTEIAQQGIDQPMARREMGLLYAQLQRTEAGRAATLQLPEDVRTTASNAARTLGGFPPESPAAGPSANSNHRPDAGKKFGMG